MPEHNWFYPIRRKLQVLAYRLTSPETVSKLYFRHELGYPLDLKEPKTFNEKLQWLKLYYWPKEPEAIACADKFAVREHIRRAGREELLNELLFTWDSADEIDWAALPQQFALKCNHGCGYNIICHDKADWDEKTVKATFHKWMHEDFGEFNAEPHYDKIPKKILCEKYLGKDVINYNIYVFNGKAVFFSVAGGLGDGIGEHLTYYNADGTLAPFKNKNYPVREEQLSPLLGQMVQTAEELSKGFPMVRVDLFDVDGKMVLSELTFTPGGGLIPFDSYESDRMLGDKLDISEAMQA